MDQSFETTNTWKIDQTTGKLQVAEIELSEQMYWQGEVKLTIPDKYTIKKRNGEFYLVKWEGK